MDYETSMIIECGYELFDRDDNESADTSFFEEVAKVKKINLDSIDLDDFDMNQLREDIEDIFNTERKYYAFDFTCLKTLMN